MPPIDGPVSSAAVHEMWDIAMLVKSLKRQRSRRAPNPSSPNWITDRPERGAKSIAAPATDLATDLATDSATASATVFAADQAIDRAAQIKLACDEAVRQERLRMARDFHDRVAPLFAAIAMQADVAEQLLDQASSIGSNRPLNRIRSMANEGFELGRDIIDARPPQPVRVRRRCAVEQMLDRFCGDHAIEAKLNWHGIADRIDAAKWHEIQGWIGEALSNAIRHAHPKRVVVQFDAQSDTQCRIQIEDDGRGMAKNPNRKGHGLQNMLRRMQSIGWTCNWLPNRVALTQSWRGTRVMSCGPID